MNVPNFDEIDLTLAIQLQSQFEEELRVQRKKEEEKVKSLEIIGYKWNPKHKDLPEPEQEKLSVSLVDPSWELLDPNPNIFDLFLTFNHQFFWGRLMGVEVKWSPRMTLCAGVCCYEGRGGLCSVRLSTPLLKLRPRKDLIETLLHEMIHAYLFVTHNNTDHDGHGPQFHKHMYRINGLAGTKITVYHSFHDEVAVYRQHVWKCNGSCKSRPPYFGLVKRAMNRPPSPRDLWWDQHERSCGGTYTKIKEPEGYGVKKSNAKGKEISVRDIRSFFPVSKNVHTKADNGANQQNKNSRFSSNFGGKINGMMNEVSKSTSQVDVKSASNANVHGFGKPSQGVPNSAMPKQTTVNGGYSKGGGGTALKNAGGSKTVVVKKNTTVNSPIDKVEDVRPQLSAFQGTGHSLGGSSSMPWPRQSRLLSQFSSNKRKHNDDAKSSNRRDSGQVTQLSRESCSPYEEQTLCPLCQNHINSDEFEKHLADCLGDFGDDDWCPMPQNVVAVANHLPNAYPTSVNSRICDSHNKLPTTKYNSVKSNDDSDMVLNSGAIVISDDEVLSDVAQVCDEPQKDCDRKFPCPVCDNYFLGSEIDNHVNQHFS